MKNISLMIKAVLLTFVLSFATAGLASPEAYAGAATTGTSQDVDVAGQHATAKSDGGLQKIVEVLKKGATYIAIFTTGVSVIMIAYAGFKYTTSQGEPKATETAKMQIIAAGIGLMIAFFALVISNILAAIVGIG